MRVAMLHKSNHKRAEAPTKRARRVKTAGRHTQRLYGRPSAGGFGLLPLNLHTRAREAVWAARLALAAERTGTTNGDHHPWAHVTDLFLRRHHPLLSASSVLTADAAGAAGPHPGTGPLPDDIRRALHALSYLPPARDVETAALPDAGDWCLNIPLWASGLGEGKEYGRGRTQKERTQNDEILAIKGKRLAWARVRTYVTGGGGSGPRGTTREQWGRDLHSWLQIGSRRHSRSATSNTSRHRFGHRHFHSW